MYGHSDLRKAAEFICADILACGSLRITHTQTIWLAERCGIDMYGHSVLRNAAEFRCMDILAGGQLRNTHARTFWLAEYT